MSYLAALLLKAIDRFAIASILNGFKRLLSVARGPQQPEPGVVANDEPMFGRRKSDGVCIEGRSRVLEKIEQAMVRQQSVPEDKYCLMLFRILGSDAYSEQVILESLQKEVRGDYMVGRFRDSSGQGSTRMSTCYTLGVHGMKSMEAGIVQLRVGKQLLNIVADGDLQIGFAQVDESMENAKALYDTARQDLIPLRTGEEGVVA